LLRMHVLTESATASEQAENRRKTGRQEASDRADDLIARFGTLLLRVRALTEGPNASEQAWNRREQLRKHRRALCLRTGRKHAGSRSEKVRTLAPETAVL
jgi:hypothetical protein